MANGMIPRDKLYHAAVGAAIGLLCLWSPIVSAVLCIVVATAKEAVWDWYLDRGTPEFMDVFATVAGWAIVATLLMPFQAKAADYHLSYSATFAPPHNEPVVGNMVARYRLQLEPSVEWEWLRYKLTATAWGCNEWRSDPGNGFPDAWEGSDWSVTEWRYSLTHRATVGPKRLGLFVENYMPLNRNSWGGHGMERHYYLLTGVGGEF